MTPRLLTLLVFAPLLEEAVFRAGLHEALLRRLRPQWPPASVNVLVALVFGLAHVAARQDAMALAVALPALLIGAVYQRWRRLRPCVALHAALNALWLGFSLT